MVLRQYPRQQTVIVPIGGNQKKNDMGAKINITGRRFGKLVAIKQVGYSGNSAIWLVKCDCGKEAEKKSKYLLNGDTKSCGCVLAKDGRTKTRIYSIWQSMMTRCYNKNRRSYKDYGKKGVIVCERWHDFFNFKEDTKQGYEDHLTLDRYPNRNGNYEPGNTRWANTFQQAKNKDRTKLYLFKGELLCVPEIAKLQNIPVRSIYSRLERGMDIEQAATPKSKTIAEIARENSIDYDRLHHRLTRLNLPLSEAIIYERSKKKEA